MRNNSIGNRPPVATTQPADAGKVATVDTKASAAASPAPASTLADQVDKGAHNAAHDMRYRAGVNAISGGPTTTAVPQLLADWKVAVHEAAAEQRADAEIIDPMLTSALAQAAQAKGDKLTRRERNGIEETVRANLETQYKSAFKAHHHDVTKSPSTKAQTERDVVLAERPRVAQLKDPFTPVIHNLPNARDNEIVLWESKNFVVVVDTWADAPKALVVPKVPVNLPVDAPAGLLDEAAFVAAHVSDAFMRATGCNASSIWINAPQNLTVAQLHVHVLPDVGNYTQDGAPAKAFIEDAQMRPQLEAWFDQIKSQLQHKLGPSTTTPPAPPAAVAT